LLGALALVLLIVSGVPIALDVVAGDMIMPDSRLYLVEKFGEMEKLAIIGVLMGDSGRGREMVRLAEERVEEVAYCLQNGMLDKAMKSMWEWGKLINMSLSLALKSNCSYCALRVYNATNRHIQILKGLSGTVPAEDLERVLNVAYRGRDIAYAVLTRIGKTS